MIMWESLFVLFDSVSFRGKHWNACRCMGNPSMWADVPVLVRSEVAQWVEAGKPNDLSSVPGTYGGIKEPAPKNVL